MTTRAIVNIGELITNDPTVGDETLLGRLSNAAMVVNDQRVLWVGPGDQVPDADEQFDADGGAVIPGFVDSHTHLVFAGERSSEFEARMRGERYDGGGIGRTVAATREANRGVLHEATLRRVRELRASGVTTMEIKSGYDLTVDGEARLVSVAREFSDEVTFLGAHSLAPEYVNDRGRYLELVTGPMLNACARDARWIDVFCDRGAFDVDEARHVLEAGLRADLELRLHGNQLGDTGGVALAVELDAASVDHCTFVNDADLEALSNSNTVATLLPGAEFFTQSPYPSMRRFLDAGVTVALATDCNPGSSYVTSMPLILMLAMREMGATFDEALWAATCGGAQALRRDDIGHLSVGARADFCVLNAPRAVHLAYRPGGMVVERVFSAPH